MAKRKAEKAFKARMRRQYAKAPQWSKGDTAFDGTFASPRLATIKIGAASKVRELSGEELAARKAELEARGLPAKMEKVLPKPKKIYIEDKGRQFFSSPHRIKGN